MTRTLFRLAFLALVAVVLSARPAAAQIIGSTTFQVQLQNPKFANLSKLDCLANPQDQTNFVFTWSFPFTPGQDEEVLLSTSQSCPEPTTTTTGSTTGTNPTSVFLRARTGRGAAANQFPAAGNSGETMDAQLLFEFATKGDITPTTAACNTPIDTTIYFCVNVFPPAGSITNTATIGAFPIHLDSTPPPTPQDVVVTPLDSGLDVTWTMPSDLQGATHYNVHVIDPQGVDHGTGIAGASGTTFETKINGLTNGVTYDVTVTSLDAAGTATSQNNESAPQTTPATGTPTHVIDFWEKYKTEGGNDKGGCASGGASLLALLGVAALFARRKRAGLAALVVAATLPAGAARADMVAAGSSWGPQPRELQSPRHYSLILRTGPYGPQIDSEAGLTGTPYKDIFGTASRLLWRVEADVDVFDAFGRLSLGLGGGFWQALGKGKQQANPTLSAPDTILLDIAPFTLSATYRADFLWERWAIPLVPFARVGYGYAYWATYKDGNLAKFNNLQGHGWAHGLEYGAGLEFILDALDPGAARNLDQDFGINTTAVFVEFDDNLWTGTGGLDLHGTNISGGLLFAF